MIRNELKELLPKGWESMFKHRDDWDPEGYSVGIFKLNESDKRETVLAKNDKTSDIMDYFFDDNLNFEITLDKASLFFTGKKNTRNIRLKDYSIKRYKNKGYVLLENCYTKSEYPIIEFYGKLLQIHRLIAFVYVPNPYPEKYTIVNHKNRNKFDFKKENLEWCDAKWNNNLENKNTSVHKRLYKRLNDNKTFTRELLAKEYPDANINSVIKNIKKSIRDNSYYNKSKWEIIQLELNEYLSKHPLRDSWYPHPIWKNVRANACGILEINGKLKIGSRNDLYYRVQFTNNGNTIIVYSHRVLAECFFGRLLEENEVIDHIIPVSETDINNSIENLKICYSQKENMNNEITKSKLTKSMSVYDLFGNYKGTYRTAKEFMKSINLKPSSLGHCLTISRKYLTDNIVCIEERLNYIYYKWKIDSYGNKICISADSSLGPLSDNYSPTSGIAIKLRKYLNTGMPAPDGFYYQQGNPKEMIYDPTNTKLEKKYPEVHWKDRNKIT